MDPQIGEFEKFGLELLFFKDCQRQRYPPKVQANYTIDSRFEDRIETNKGLFNKLQEPHASNFI